MTDQIIAESSSEITRDELYKLVWTTPGRHLASSFGVSDSYLVRVCAALNVPRPPAGYWQKKAVGKSGPVPDLPDAQPGDQTIWSKEKPLAHVRKQVPVRAAPMYSPSKVRRTGLHPLLNGTEVHYRKSRPYEGEEFLRPFKVLLPDITASDTVLRHALDTASEIFNAFDAQGHRVMIAPPDQSLRRCAAPLQETPLKDNQYGRHGYGALWSPLRPTIVWLGDVPFGLVLTEMTERISLQYLHGNYYRADSTAIRNASRRDVLHSWTTQRDAPCGRLRLAAYSPYPGVGWQNAWQETSKQSLKSLIPAIIRNLEASKNEVMRLMKKADEDETRRKREWVEKLERHEREEDRRKVEQAKTDSRNQLADIMQEWQDAITVQSFFADAISRLDGLDDARRATIMERLEKAQTLIGSTDPLSFLEQWIAPDERYKTKF
ncbi:hypothetical protein Brsp04_04637 [Brucella sp. NBRC 12952]